MTILVTGGAGFIGSNFVLDWMRISDETVVTVDNLTYAGNLSSLKGVLDDGRHIFVRADIRDEERIGLVLESYRPNTIIHFAAETHVDRSIFRPEDFVFANTVGTFKLLEAARSYWAGLSQSARHSFRFINVSTDEVYGSLDVGDVPFVESSPYSPNSPYSASKAAADHLVRSYYRTYGFPGITTNCSNNYGPFQFPEKLVPLMILNGVRGRKLPVYGDGKNIRDWLYVGDHCAAIRMLIEKGSPGERYNIGGNKELKNIEVVEQICDLLDEILETDAHKPHRQLIELVADRPGHDRRYAVDTGKINRELGWKPSESFESGLQKTVQWYLANEAWVADVESGSYRDWMKLNYENRSCER